MPERKRMNRVVLSLFGLGLCLFVFLSLWSFSVYDWPNPDVVSTAEPANLCGPVGAYLAYICNYYFGPASMVFLFAVAGWLILFALNKDVEQIVLRIIGVVLLGAAVSAIFYLYDHGNTESLSHGNGGVIGIAMGHFLLKNTAMTGAVLILIATIIVGSLLAADNLVLLIPKLMLMMAERMRKAGPVLAGVSSKAGDITAKTCDVGVSGAKKAIAMAIGSRDDENLDEYEEDDEGGVAVQEKEKPKRKGKKKAVVEPEDEYENEIEDDEDIDEVEEFEDAEPEEMEEADDEPEMKVKTSKKAEPIVASTLANMIRPIIPAKTPAGVNNEDYSEYTFPPLDLLEEPVLGYSEMQEQMVRESSQVLKQTLQEFKIDADVVAAETGPVISMFELKLAPGIKVSQITNLSNDLARSLGAPAVRIVAPIPGKHTIGIEVPNREKETVRIKELLQLGGTKPSKMQIPLFLGKDATGTALIVDLTEMPHCLIAGTTGSGKSVCINSIILSILLTQRPDMVKMILVDPKMVEMTAFRDLAHLMCPIVTEMKRAEQILEWLTEKMDERYALLAEARVRHIKDYNKLTEEQIYERFSPSNEMEKAKIPLRLPYLVVIIDELADLMMTSAKEVEGYIIRLAQKSRAVGIHIVLATQRPQATVVTGLIKSNLPSRISFRVAARMDSRIVLDQNGAETLLGRGDMLFLQPGTSELIRCQGSYVDDDEVNRIVKYLKEVAQPNYHPELVQMNHLDTGSMEKDELFEDAVRVVLETRRGSVSLLQRRLTVGYSRASRLIDQMAMAGIVGEYKGSQAREVLITLDEYERICQQMARDAAAGYKDLQDDEEFYNSPTTVEDSTDEPSIATSPETGVEAYVEADIEDEEEPQAEVEDLEEEVEDSGDVDEEIEDDEDEEIVDDVEDDEELEEDEYEDDDEIVDSEEEEGDEDYEDEEYEDDDEYDEDDEDLEEEEDIEDDEEYEDGDEEEYEEEDDEDAEYDDDEEK